MVYKTANILITSIAFLFLIVAANADEASRRVAIGSVVSSPMGWVQFCADNPSDCAPKTTSARDIVMTQKVWADLGRVNKYVNDTVKPITDSDHWGAIEKWSYPSDGYGDCEDYVLQKRKILIDAGWPQESLLVTVVRDKNDEGHAVLTVTTDKGEFVLDNEITAVVPWYETGYRYIKRQSQTDLNKWVAIGVPASPAATATAR
ncbi:transglutaminase-like cysteine peptidase [Bradyrhizobium sp. 180]|uniref:transglutaminase-like cysteine peptidase n=1 Tax=unclassified Bradyrhizobium TaxID=2631580 RepID=UPI001FF81AF0|nr:MULTISPECIES: transglutaminase-like cysteine peptidase [unclassified Bradyrhizobium]MCK1492137.1 transglutaminase-like cysteine peptidase [Bradyrhizobium sp. 180]MCK1719491.1 transglutaminase-like cysteine peptidase [Bradyrhizobium sp. 141]